VSLSVTRLVSSPINSAIDFDGHLVDRKANQVNFDPKVVDKPSAKISRDLTPFPKELHNKAMQWRMSRDVTLGGSGQAGHSKAGPEGGEASVEAGASARADVGVVMRKTLVVRPGNNRNSLMNALSNPLDEVR